MIAQRANAVMNPRRADTDAHTRPTAVTVFDSEPPTAQQHRRQRRAIPLILTVQCQTVRNKAVCFRTLIGAGP
jgi:hypothetical protein